MVVKFRPKKFRFSLDSNESPRSDGILTLASSMCKWPDALVGRTQRNQWLADFESGWRPREFAFLGRRDNAWARAQELADGLSPDRMHRVLNHCSELCVGGHLAVRIWNERFQGFSEELVI
jgi:hypothetical protein